MCRDIIKKCLPFSLHITLLVFRTPCGVNYSRYQIEGHKKKLVIDFMFFKTSCVGVLCVILKAIKIYVHVYNSKFTLYLPRHFRFR